MYSLGAIQKDTGEYILPKDAQKGVEYICMDCEQKVIFRKGVQRRAHFAHYSPTNTCSYYEHPNESQIHKDAKYRFATWLAEKRKIEFIWFCPECSIHNGGEDSDTSHTLKYDENDEVVVEYRDPNNRYIADIAILNNNRVKYIFEIQHTHKTTTDVRPEPWFEIDTEQIYNKNEITFHENTEEEYICIHCRRNSSKRKCDACKAKTEVWVLNLPTLDKKVGMEGKWTQIKSCIKCNRNQYNPLWIKGYRQICKICFAQDLESLRQEYSHSICMMED